MSIPFPNNGGNNFNLVFKTLIDKHKIALTEWHKTEIQYYFQMRHHKMTMYNGIVVYGIMTLTLMLQLVAVVTQELQHLFI